MKRAALVIIVLLSLSLVQADLVVQTFTNDFSITADETGPLSICACEQREDPVLITNTGNFPTQYTVAIDAEQDWFGSSRSAFALEPGESTIITIGAEIPCDAREPAAYTAVVTSEHGRDRVLHRELDVRQCQNLLLEVTGPETSNVLDPVTYAVTIRNVGEFIDRYQLDLGEYSEYASFSGPNSTTIPPNEHRVLTVMITPPPDLIGAVTIPFTLRSERNGLAEEKYVELLIENRYDHELVIQEGISLCAGELSATLLTLRNHYDAPNEYTFSLAGPDFAPQEIETVALGAYGERTLELAFTPEIEHVGDHELRIRSTSRYGDITRDRTLDLHVNECYRFSAAIVETEANAATACCGEHSFALNIRNEGSTTETFRIATDAPSWFLAEEQTITLTPNENRNVRLLAAIPCVDRVEEIPITVSLERLPSLTKEFLFTLTTQTPHTCTAVELEPSTVRVDPETEMVSFIVRSTGSQGGTYTITTNSSLYTPIENEIHLDPGAQGVLHLEPGNFTNRFFGRYPITLTLTHDDQTYTHDFWTEYTTLPWLTKAWRALTGFQMPACLWFAALLVVLLIIAIILFILGRHALIDEHALFVLRSVLIIGLFITLLTLGLLGLPSEDRFYEKPVEYQGTVLQWREGETLTIDLSDYFEDPDEDVLTYASSQPKDISVDIEGDLAMLTPDPGFSGWSQIVFTARDSKGGVVDSPFIGLRVLERYETGMLDKLIHYCTQVNLWLFALLLFVLLLGSLFLMPRREPVEPPRIPPPVKALPTQKAARSRKRSAVKAPTRSAKSVKATPARRSTARLETPLVASKTGDKVHDPQCVLAQRIPRKRRIGFSSKSTAVKKGYVPCKVCQPFD